MTTNNSLITQPNTVFTLGVGARVNLNITPPSEAGNSNLTIKITSLPTQGGIFLPNGQPVTMGEVLTAYQLATLIYQAPASGSGAMGGFAYQVSDGKGATASETVTLSVAAPPPVVQASKALSVAEGGKVNLAITAPTDAAGNALTITVTSLPTSGSIMLATGQTVTIGQTLTAAQLAALAYQAPANSTGATGGFSYQVSDGKGGTASETVSLSVTAPPPPVVQASKSISLGEGAIVALGISAPTDAAGNPMTITVTGLPTNGSILAAGLKIANGQTLTAAQLTGLVYLAPAASSGAMGGFSYQVSDGKGGIASETVSLSVNPPPVAEANKTVIVDRGTQLGLAIAAPTDAAGNALTIMVTGLPANGSITLANGQKVAVGQTLTTAQLTGLVYQAPANSSGPMGGFSYQVSDGKGGYAYETVTLSVSLPPVVDTAKTVSVAEGSKVNLAIVAPTDASGNALTITVTTLPTSGSIMLSSGQAVAAGQVLTAAQLTGLVYQAPAAGSGAMGGFSYQVADGKGATLSDTVSLSVTAPPPVVQADIGISTAFGSSVALGITAPTDAAGNPMTITVDTLPQAGTVHLANGTAVTVGEVLTAAQLTGLIFQAPATGGKIGAPTLFGDFSYTVSDSKGGQATQNVDLFGNAITTGTPANPPAASLITESRQSYIARPDGLINLGTIFQVPAGANAPATIVITSEDENHYAGAETYDYGTLTAKSGVVLSGGYTLTFTLVNGQYVTTNSASFTSTNGETLSDFTFQASAQNNRVQNFGITAFDKNGNPLQTQTVAIVTSATGVDTTPGVASAAEMVQVAQSFVGQTWDSQGCWNLVQDISARAGASLSLASANGIAAGTANGQWSVAYNAATGPVNANWMSTLKAGDVVQLDWNNANFGHVMVVSQVSNGQVFVIDNSGPAATGPGTDAADVLIAQTNLTAEAANINSATVEVYRLSGAAPAVSDLPPTVAVGYNTNLQVGQTVAAAPLFQASDPDNQAVTAYEVLDAGGGSGHFALNGVTQADGKWIAVTPGSLANLTYTGGSGASTDTIEVMASDGQMWSGVTTGRAVTLPSGTANANSNTPTNLGTLSGNTVLTATDALSPTEIQHYYSFTLAQAAAVTVTLTDLAANCDLYIYGPAGSGYSAGSTKGGTQDQSITATLAAGTYLVRPNYQTGATQSNATDFNLAIGLGTSVVTPVPPLVPPPPQTQLLASAS